ncbi:CARDB [Aedoeadaptatus ivorii]|uniref:CARDB n=1 Tax=Aedoeadaptatus ivorii TaxID=54006 RepID=A0A448V1Y3_9FIRM|nr:hypothetical protein [Peptoniphilus ivorii]VEJ35842.1 CARDB [Peptoniphilus ivorii]
MKKRYILALASAIVFTQTIPPVAFASETTGEIPPPKVESESHAPISILDFTDVRWPESVPKNKDIPVNFSIKNSGNGAAKNIVIRAISQDLEHLVPKSVSQVNAKHYEPGQKESYSFSFRLNADAPQKNYAVKLSLAYVDINTNEVHESSQVITLRPDGGASSANGGSAPGAAPGGGMEMPGDVSSVPSFSGGGGGGGAMPDFSGADLGPSLPVTGTGDTPQGQAPTGANTPKIIIDDYSYDPVHVKAGVPFSLHFRVFNTNRKKTVRNIRVSLSADAAEPMSLPGAEGGAAAAAQTPPVEAAGGGSAFIPVGSSNTFHIEKISPRKHAAKEITLTTAPNTAARTYTITATFEYEDGDGNPYTSSEVIGIPVEQSSEITPGDVTVDKDGFVDEAMPLSMEFYNTGKSPVSNVMVKMRGNFEADTNTYFAGTVAAGASETYDVNITPTAEGEQKGEIVLTFDDASGQKQEIVKPFTVNVQGPDAAAEDDEANGQDDRPAWAVPAALLAVAAIAGGVGVYVVKKRKSKNDDEGDLSI